MRTIYFDMDGTIADLYGQENWLKRLQAEEKGLYQTAKPLIDLRTLRTKVNRLQEFGYKISVITWLARGVSEDYDKIVAKEKLIWLDNTGIEFDEIHIVKYGTEKQNIPTYIDNDILFDDNADVRLKWASQNGLAFDEKNILLELNNILKGAENE